MLVRHDPYPKGAGLDCLRFLRPSTYAHRVRQTATKLCTVIKKEKILQSRSRPLHWPKLFVTRMLTHDLFAVANFLVLVAIVVRCCSCTLTD